jgi:hypothetical protein
MKSRFERASASARADRIGLQRRVAILIYRLD